MLLSQIKSVFACITILLCLSLFFVYFKNRDLKGFLYAGLFFLCSSLYLLGQSHLELNLSPVKAVFWSKVGYAGVFGYAFTVPLIISFIAEREINSIIKKWLGIITTFTILCVAFTGLIIRSDVEYRLGILQSKLSPSFPFLIGILLAIGLISLFNMFRTSTRHEFLKMKYLYVSVGFAICISIGIMDLISTLNNKPIISGVNELSVFGIFIISLLFYWSFMSQYSIVLSTLRKTENHVERLQKKSEESLIEFVNLIAKTLDAKDHYTAGHSLRVMEYATEIARALNLSTSEIELLKQACLLHDIGKIGIPDGVLQKKTSLTKKDRDYVEKHPSIAREILSTVTDFQDLLKIIYHHHERVDGKGYPNGVKKDDIPLLARIIAIADTYDAMRSKRPYRKAMSKSEAIQELNKTKGSQLDEELVDKFIEAIS